MTNLIVGSECFTTKAFTGLPVLIPILLTAADYLGISNQNGLEINLLQAAIGFNIINKEEKLSNILNIMRS